MAREFTAEDFGKWFPTRGGDEFCPLGWVPLKPGEPPENRRVVGVVGRTHRDDEQYSGHTLPIDGGCGYWQILWPPVVEERTERRWLASDLQSGYASFGLKPSHIETIRVDFALRYEDGTLVSVTAKVVEP